jgi:predicted aminopeptidase
MNHHRFSILLCGGLVAFCGGCMDPGYFLHIARGELHSLSRSRPITRVLAAGGLSPAHAHKLVLVQQVRVYARDCIGLKVGSAYTHFEDNACGPVAYAASGSRRDQLEPYKWTYPIIGEYEAKGFFDRGLAEQEAQRLRRKGYDATISEVSGFSTMGILPDPIRSSNLQGDDIDLAILVFHELTHNTIFKPSDTQFNESMATFVGRAAALQYFRDTCGKDSPPAAAAARRLADLTVIDGYVSDLYRRLDALYHEPISKEEKIAQREVVLASQRQRFVESYEPLLKEPQLYRSLIDRLTDNAMVLAAYRYHSDLEVYTATHARLGGDLRAVIALLRKAARHRDSQAFLQNWLATHREGTGNTIVKQGRVVPLALNLP